jgi:hypothetical protein
MNLSEYQIAAMRTAGETLSDQLNGLVRAALGIAGETLSDQLNGLVRAALGIAGETLSDQLTGLVTAALGIAGETGELIEEFIYGRSKQATVKELGDCLWYVARACHALNIDMARFADATAYSTDITTESIGPELAIAGARFADAVKKNFAQGHAVDVPLLTDYLHRYMAMLGRMCLMVGVGFPEVADANIEKLRQRFPDGFAVERSVGR